MISATQLTSPFHSTGGAVPLSSKPASEIEQPAVQRDVVETGATAPAEKAAPAQKSASSNGFKRAGAALMVGVAVLGSGVLAPATASARPLYMPYAQSHFYSAPVQYQHHDRGDAAAALIAGAIIGTAVGVIASQSGQPAYEPAPVYVPADPGYNGAACDGQYHHFDSAGNVADQTGHYRLFLNPYNGACQAGPASY